MKLRNFTLLVLTAFAVALPSPAHAYQNSVTAVINGHAAGGTTALASFRKDTTLPEIEAALAAKGMTVHSYHTRTGARFAPAEVKSPTSLRAGDLSFVLVEFSGFDLAEALRRLRSMTRLESSSPNYIWHPLWQPNDPYYAEYQGNFQQIGAENAWNYSSGQGAVVAVIDTGYRTGLDDGAQHLLTGYDFWGNDTNVNDFIGHGTHVSNTIAERTDNSIGVAGLAYNATILPAKVFPDWDEGALESDIDDAIYWAVEQGADIINMSLGGGDYVSYTDDACQYARTNNVIVFAASGNSGVSPVEYPAAYDSVVAVGSSRPHSLGAYPSRSDFANYGTALDVVAPGEEILQETYDPSYGAVDYYLYSGTSMASPHAAAVAALMIGAGATNADNIIQTLYDTAFKSGSGWDSQLGWGEVNADGAVSYYADDDVVDDDVTDDDVTDDDVVDDDVVDDDATDDDVVDDDADDDVVDDDATDDAADDATDDAADDASDDDNSYCSDLLTLIYTHCQLALVNNGEPISGDTAYQYCLDGTGDWACVLSCSNDSNVSGCDTFAQCLSEACHLPTQDMSQDDDASDDAGSDDDNSGSSAGSSCGC